MMRPLPVSSLARFTCSPGEPLNRGRSGKESPTLTLERAEAPVPERIPAAGSELVPFHAGETLRWRFVEG